MMRPRRGILGKGNAWIGLQGGLGLAFALVFFASGLLLRSNSAGNNIVLSENGVASNDVSRDSSSSKEAIPKADSTSPSFTADVLIPKPESVLNNSAVTIVTAYFNLASAIGEKKIKHSHAFYLDTGKVLLSMKSPMIIFTDVDIVATGRATIAPEQPTHVIRMSLMDLKVVEKYLDALKQLHSKDLEPHLYSPHLYALYHGKSELMRIAAELNPFQTQKVTFFVCVGVVLLYDLSRSIFFKAYMG